MEHSFGNTNISTGSGSGHERGGDVGSHNNSSELLGSILLAWPTAGISIDVSRNMMFYGSTTLHIYGDPDKTNLSGTSSPSHISSASRGTQSNLSYHTTPACVQSPQLSSHCSSHNLCSTPGTIARPYPDITLLWEACPDLPLWCLVFSPNNERIASSIEQGTIYVQDVKSAAVVLGPLLGHSDAVCSLVFSPDGARIASGSSDNIVRVWDSENGVQVIKPLVFCGSCVIQMLAFSPDGSLIAFTTWSRTVQIWDANTGDCLYTLFEHFTVPARDLSSTLVNTVLEPSNGGEVTCIAFSPDSKYLAAAGFGSEGKVQLWDARTWQPVCTVKNDFWSFSVAFSLDSKRFACGSNFRVCVWDTKTHAFLGALGGGSVMVFAFSPDGKRITASGEFEGSIRILDVDTGNLILQHLTVGTWKSFTDTAAVSLDGTLVANWHHDDNGAKRLWVYAVE